MGSLPPGRRSGLVHTGPLTIPSCWPTILSSRLAGAVSRQGWAGDAGETIYGWRAMRGDAVADLEFDCPYCRQRLSVEAGAARRTVACPSCGHALKLEVEDGEPAGFPKRTAAPPTLPGVLAPGTPPPAPPGLAPPAEDKGNGVLLAGWICFGVGAGLMVVLLIIPIWGPLFVASCILSIIGIVQGKTGQGVALLLCSLLGPMLIGFLMAVVFVGGCAAVGASAMSVP